MGQWYLQSNEHMYPVIANENVVVSRVASPWFVAGQLILW